ncbi:hypothetical protein ABPG72_018712 [Tetrahymena utriculariae]
MHFAQAFHLDPKLDTNQDIFYDNQIIHEPEYFLNLTTNSQEIQFQLANQQILEVAYQKQQNQYSPPSRHEMILAKQAQECNSAGKLNKLKNGFEDKYYFEKLQKDNSQTALKNILNSSTLEDKFYEAKYAGCSVQSLEQQSTNITLTYNEIEEQHSTYQNDKKKFKNSNILKDIFNSFHRYVKDLKFFPVFDIQKCRFKRHQEKFQQICQDSFIQQLNNKICPNPQILLNIIY